jgi:hypothetical protein
MKFLKKLKILLVKCSLIFKKNTFAMAASVPSNDKSLQDAYSALEKHTKGMKDLGYDDDRLAIDPLSIISKLGIIFKEKGKEAAIADCTRLPDCLKREGPLLTILFNSIKNDKIKQDCDLTVKLEF